MAHLSTYLIGMVHRCDWYVPNGSEFAAIIQMFILQSEIIPHESSQHFQRTQQRHHHLTLNIARFDQTHRQRPSESQHQIFGHSKVIEPIRRIHGFFAQKFIVACIRIEQAPIHFDVPRVRVARRDNRRNDPQIEIRIGCVT